MLFSVGMKIKAKTGAATAATIAASDEILKIANTHSHTKREAVATCQESANNTPTAVATPLPPLNLRKIGNICPNKTASATSAVISSGCLKTWLDKKTTSQPLIASPSKVNAAASLFPPLKTLVAPGLPEP